MSEAEKALEAAQEAAAKMCEFADSCQIFLTIHDSSTGITRHIAHGVGNWFAREGQVREWVMQNQERSLAEVRMEDDDE